MNEAKLDQEFFIFPNGRRSGENVEMSQEFWYNTNLSFFYAKPSLSPEIHLKPLFLKSWWSSAVKHTYIWKICCPISSNPLQENLVDVVTNETKK